MVWVGTLGVVESVQVTDNKAILPVAESGWQGELSLGFRWAGSRTVIHHRHHRGPLRIQRPFYPEASGTCHVYLLHPPGGLVGGDQLTFSCTLGDGARTLLTTPGAGKFYRSNGPLAVQQNTITLADRACLEWFPQESIVFDGAQMQSITRVELSADSRFIGWDILCLGRPDAAEQFSHGHVRQRFELWQDGLPLWLDRAEYAGGSAQLQARWGLQGRPVVATLVCTGSGQLEAARAALGAALQGEHLVATQLDTLLVCRYLGAQAERARQVFQAVWQAVRPDIMGHRATPPRIWRT